MKIGYLGIDVSKGYADFVLLSDNKKVLEEPFQLDDTQDGHSRLLSLLKKFNSKHKLTGVYAGLESTGGYENNWLTFLKNEGHWVNVKTARVNPYGVKHDGMASMDRTTTDVTSARQIAHYLMNHPNKINWEESGYDVMDSLRSMYNYIRTRVKQKVQLLNQLEKIIYTAFPELMVFMREQTPQWLLMVLERYPTAAAMREASIEDLTEIKHIDEKKAIKLRAKAEQSISWADNSLLRQLISGYARDLLDLIKQIENLKKNLEKISDSTPEINILESFQGIAKYSAIGLMSEIEDISRFQSSNKICSFFGIHPKFKQSGDKTSGVKMSKQGSPEVRAILFMVAKSALVYNPHIRKIYDRFRQQGMGYYQAMGVIMHKILRIVYGMLKTKTIYNPEYDLSKQQKTIEYNTKKVVNSQYDDNNKQRNQEVNENAPISKRQLNKRKEQNSSTNSKKEYKRGMKNALHANL